MRAIAQGQTDADVFAGYGEMLVLGTNGIVGLAGVRAAFASALQRDAKNEVARYYDALADAQAGDSKRAIASWQGLAADLPEDLLMREAIGKQVADAASTAGSRRRRCPKASPPPRPRQAPMHPRPARPARPRPRSRRRRT